MVDAAASSMPSPAALTPFWENDIRTRLAEFDDIRRRSGGIEFLEESQGRGFWSVTSYDYVRQVSRDPVTFSSARGFSLDEIPPEALELLGSIIAMDDPEHQLQRRLVQSAFSPRAIKQMTNYVAELADAIVAELRDSPSFDFVEVVGAHLPFQVICDLLDIPSVDRPRLRRLIDLIIGVNDADFGGQTKSIEALGEFFSYTMDLGKHKLEHPGEDITSTLMHAELDGKRLTPQEFGSFVILLASAGNDTTRTALAWAMHLLSENPEQRDELAGNFAELNDNAIDEILRWCSPVLHMRRTVTRDTVLGGQPIAAGDKVVMWYLAADHDSTVFEAPETFDIHRRNARDHIAFGAGGPHFCLGSNLAKMEVRVVLDRLLTAFPGLHTTGPPQLLRSQFVNGIKSLPCATG
jgi:cytochrome P450